MVFVSLNPIVCIWIFQIILFIYSNSIYIHFGLSFLALFFTLILFHSVNIRLKKARKKKNKKKRCGLFYSPNVFSSFCSSGKIFGCAFRNCTNGVSSVLDFLKACTQHQSSSLTISPGHSSQKPSTRTWL